MSRFKLRHDDAGYHLVDQFTPGNPLRVDFSDGTFSHRLKGAGLRSELVARAVKPEAGLMVLDCTGGLGRDAFILAHLGCIVTILERSPVVHTLLADGIDRASTDASLASTAARLNVEFGDAKQRLQGLDYFDVIYLDPMFPVRRKAALVKGEMQYLQNLLGSDPDVDELLTAALASKAKRVVLKRPAHSDWQSPRKPNHEVSAKTSRFEVFVP